MAGSLGLHLKNPALTTSRARIKAVRVSFADKGRRMEKTWYDSGMPGSYQRSIIHGGGPRPLNPLRLPGPKPWPPVRAVYKLAGWDGWLWLVPYGFGVVVGVAIGLAL